jgi:acetolactate synthase-1/2/3 large subunit
MVFRQRNSQRFEMDMSAAEVKRAASAQPQNSHADPNGSEILVRCLQAEGVKYLWGYPGGAVLYIYDALYKQDSIQHVLVRHEQAAVHAADGYARATGDVGVALVTSGPGVTNAVTGIATAYMDSIPMVIITGQVPTPAIGLDAFQECDTVGITRPIVKHNFLVKDVRDLALTIKKAFHIARTGRPGPGGGGHPQGRLAEDRTLPLPGEGGDALLQPGAQGPWRADPQGGAVAAAGQAALHLHRRRRDPGQCVGRAARTGRPAGLPCTNTLMGLGAIAGQRPQFLGMLGMHGTYEANMTMQHCDVLLAVGARFDDRVIGNPKHFASVERKIIHVDIDPSSISKRVKVDIPIVGDVKDVLQELIAQIREAQSAARRRRACRPGGARSTTGASATAWPTSSSESSSRRPW